MILGRFGLSMQTTLKQEWGSDMKRLLTGSTSLFAGLLNSMKIFRSKSNTRRVN